VIKKTHETYAFREYFIVFSKKMLTKEHYFCYIFQIIYFYVDLSHNGELRSIKLRISRPRHFNDVRWISLAVLNIF